MRLRNIKGADDAILASPYEIQETPKKAGTWHSIFQNSNPIHVEIGMGKGSFIMGMAKAHPDINYVGIERYSSVLIRALEKYEEAPLPNLLFMCMNAEFIEDVFAPLEVDRIYLNFSDPWPKDRHAKRRLTSTTFLTRYNHILVSDGTLEFKTDNRDLFDFSIESIQEANWNLDVCTYDLHHDETLSQGNIMTEYEEKFSSKGNPIHKLITSRTVC